MRAIVPGRAAPSRELGDRDRDVVGAARGQREPHEGVGDLLGRSRRRQDGREPGRRHDGVHAVAQQHHPVARHDAPHEQIGCGRRPRRERPVERRTVGMRGGLVGGQATGRDEREHMRVVLREHVDPAVPHEVRARVADMGEHEPLALDRGDRERGPELAARAGGDERLGLVPGPVEGAGEVVARRERAHEGARDDAEGLLGEQGILAEAVGDAEHAAAAGQGALEGGVLLGGSRRADVRARRDGGDARGAGGVDGGHDRGLPGAPESGEELQDGAVATDRVGALLAPPRADLARRGVGGEVAHDRDPREPHAHAAQGGDEAGAGHLVGPVRAVPGDRVDRARGQQPRLVVQAQRLRAQPARGRELADRQGLVRAPRVR